MSEVHPTARALHSALHFARCLLDPLLRLIRVSTKGSVQAHPVGHQASTWVAARAACTEKFPWVEAVPSHGVST
eukprot:13220682-Alexandrium_andersonii.AAC.1